MKTLITGANGLLGQKLVRLLQEQPQVELLATGRGACRLSGLPPHQYRHLDVTDRQAVMALLHEWQPDSVVHTAAMTQVDDCELNPAACRIANVEAVANVVASCEAVGAHLVHLSTDFIFDGSHGPLDEKATPNPVNYYGQTKLEAEKLVQQAATGWAIARTVLVYGVVPGLSRSNIILWVKESLEQGKTIRVVDDQWRTPTLAEDLAMGCWLLAKNKAQGVYNISGADMLTPYQMALQVADYFGLDKRLIVRADSTTFSQPAKRPPRTGFIIDKAKNELGYRPHSFTEGIAIVARQVAGG